MNIRWVRIQLFALYLGVTGISATAAAGDGVDITVTNDGTDDIMVTVYDLAIGPSAIVLAHTRINGFTTIPISVSPDNSGRASVSWTAVSVDPDARKCGHADRVGLSESGSLTVHADSTCPAAS